MVAFTPRPIPIPTSVADTDVGEAIRTCSIFQISVTDVIGDRAIPVCLDGRKPHRRRGRFPKDGLNEDRFVNAGADPGGGGARPWPPP